MNNNTVQMSNIAGNGVTDIVVERLNLLHGAQKLSQALEFCNNPEANAAVDLYFANEEEAKRYLMAGPQKRPSVEMDKARYRTCVKTLIRCIMQMPDYLGPEKKKRFQNVLKKKEDQYIHAIAWDLMADIVKTWEHETLLHAEHQKDFGKITTYQHFQQYFGYICLSLYLSKDITKRLFDIDFRSKLLTYPHETCKSSLDNSQLNAHKGEIIKRGREAMGGASSSAPIKRSRSDEDLDGNLALYNLIKVDAQPEDPRPPKRIKRATSSRPRPQAPTISTASVPLDPQVLPPQQTPQFEQTQRPQRPRQTQSEQTQPWDFAFRQALRQDHPFSAFGNLRNGQTATGIEDTSLPIQNSNVNGFLYPTVPLFLAEPSSSTPGPRNVYVNPSMPPPPTLATVSPCTVRNSPIQDGNVQSQLHFEQFFEAPAPQSLQEQGFTQHEDDFLVAGYEPFPTLSDEQFEQVFQQHLLEHGSDYAIDPRVLE